MVVVAAVVAGVALVLNGGIGGLFYAYSISVVPALDAIEADKAVRAMQSVNRRILNPAFFATFLGAPVASAATGGVLLALGQPVAGALISWPPWCTCWACSCRPGW